MKLHVQNYDGHKALRDIESDHYVIRLADDWHKVRKSIRFDIRNATPGQVAEMIAKIVQEALDAEHEV